MTTRRADIRKPQVDGWSELQNHRTDQGKPCGQCLACRFPDGTPCATDPRWLVTPQSDGHLYRRHAGGWWERLP